MSSLQNEAIDKADNVDNVNHPLHYVSHPSGVEAISITREFSFVLGNAWKYLMRFRYKGKPKEDLDKAVWYMNDYMCHGCVEKESVFAPTKTVEKTDEIIKNARRVIAAETVPEVKHAMRSILEHALFGTDVACDFFKAKIELEEQTEKIAKSLLLGDEFDVVSANVILGADELLKELEESDAKDKERAEKVKAKADAELEKINEHVPSDEWMADHSFNNDEAISVTVDDKTHTVVPSTVELDPKRQYHTEIVKLPPIVASLEKAKQREWAENVVANQLAMVWPKPEPFVEVNEAPAPEISKKKRRTKKTAK